MKNIFKLMGVALIAGSMLFVACKKDENNDDQNNNNNNNQPVNNDPTVSVKWNDAEQTIGYQSASSIQGIVYIMDLAKGLTNEDGVDYIDMPEFYISLMTANSQWGLSAQFGQQYAQQFPTEVYYETYFQDQQGNEFGDYELYDLGADPSVTNFDATANKADIDLNLIFASYADVMDAYHTYVENGGDLNSLSDEEYKTIINQWYDAADKGNMVLAARNYVFTARQ